MISAASSGVHASANEKCCLPTAACAAIASATIESILWLCFSLAMRQPRAVSSATARDGRDPHAGDPDKDGGCVPGSIRTGSATPRSNWPASAEILRSARRRARAAVRCPSSDKDRTKPSRCGNCCAARAARPRWSPRSRADRPAMAGRRGATPGARVAFAGRI